MLTKEQILGSSKRVKNLKKTVGVYFLIKNDEIVYIGSSRNVLNRIHSSIHKAKDFDSYYILHVAKKDILQEIEAKYVIKFAPRLNVNVPCNGFATFAGSVKEIKNMRINLKATVIGEKLYYIIPDEFKVSKDSKIFKDMERAVELNTI